MTENMAAKAEIIKKAIRTNSEADDQVKLIALLLMEKAAEWIKEFPEASDQEQRDAWLKMFDTVIDNIADASI